VGETSTRTYSSELRREQVKLTRRRVLDAAADLFLRQGYVGTTLDAVAASAGVSLQTVYNVVGGKAKLLQSVYDEMVPTDLEPVSRKMLSEPDPRRCLAWYAVGERVTNERVGPLLMVIHNQAAAGDRDLRTLVEQLERDRLASIEAFVRHLAIRFGLRPGLTTGRAADMVWALTTPEMADRLVRRRGWDWDQFEAWIAVTIADALLGCAPED
jgi:AcrR family transcriptional regulator